MGKVPPSFRSALSNPNLINRSPLIPSSSKPQYFPKKIPSNSSGKSRKPHKEEPPLPPKPISLFKSPSLQDAKNIFNSIVKTSNAPNDFRFHNSLLQSYASISTINDSIAFLRHMAKAHPSFSPDKSTYHILLTQSCKSTDSTLSPIHQTLNLMVSDGVTPDKVTVDLSVRALCSADRVDDAVELIKELSSKHCCPDTYTFNFLVKNLCKCRTLSTVYTFIDEMRRKFDVKPDLVTYTILIDNEKGVEPDLVTYNTLIYGLSKSGRVSEAKKLLRVMVERGHFPDEITYTSLMNGMCRKGETLVALALLEEMEMKGCSPNSCTYNTLLHGLCKSRMFDKAMELYGVMKSGDLKLDMASYATFVRALCSMLLLTQHWRARLNGSRKQKKKALKFNRLFVLMLARM
ncbi:hypothetical protein P8452_73288 [Trifolium repens]|nr:hypothetical protein P8452_73288 [Trifolium repens]